MSPETISSGEGMHPKPDLPVRPIATLSEQQTMSATDIGWEMLTAESEPYWPVPEEFNERLDGGEVANPDAHYFDIFNLAEEERQELVNRIQENDGVVRVLVHPYYSLHEIHSQNQVDDLERIDGMLHKILERKKTDRPPVIIMEGYQTIEELYKLLREFNQDDVYIAPTFCDTAQPYPSPDSLQYSTEKEKDSPNWPEFINLLEELGVKRILIGGQYISVNSMQHLRTEENRYGRCVGFVINHLRKNFDLKISNASNYTRSEIRKLFEYDAKQNKHDIDDNL